MSDVNVSSMDEFEDLEEEEQWSYVEANVKPLADKYNSYLRLNSQSHICFVICCAYLRGGYLNLKHYLGIMALPLKKCTKSPGEC